MNELSRSLYFHYMPGLMYCQKVSHFSDKKDASDDALQFFIATINVFCNGGIVFRDEKAALLHAKRLVRDGRWGGCKIFLQRGARYFSVDEAHKLFSDGVGGRRAVGMVCSPYPSGPPLGVSEHKKKTV